MRCDSIFSGFCSDSSSSILNQLWLSDGFILESPVKTLLQSSSLLKINAWTSFSKFWRKNNSFNPGYILADFYNGLGVAANRHKVVSIILI